MQYPSAFPAVAPLTLALLGLSTFQAGAARPHEQDLPDTAHSISTSWGVIQQPTLPTQVCATLKAALVPVAGSLDTLDSDPAQSSAIPRVCERPSMIAPPAAPCVWSPAMPANLAY